MTFLRLWLIGTAVFIVGAMIWGFAPILVPLLLVFVGLAALVAIIVRLARALERWRASQVQDEDKT
jgi:uncharacterized membrane protein YuzA (DUF378 family)